MNVTGGILLAMALAVVAWGVVNFVRFLRGLAKEIEQEIEQAELDSAEELHPPATVMQPSGCATSNANAATKASRSPCGSTSTESKKLTTI